MYYRRKVILALIQVFEGELDKIRLQKLLFLFTQKQEKPDYEFVPYKFGCFSYSANADLTAMTRKGVIAETTTTFKSEGSVDYTNELKPTDRLILMQVKARFDKMDSNALMKYTYINYPFYAINSVKAKTLLDNDAFKQIDNARPVLTDQTLYTIGYEGVSLEAYLNKLIRYDIKVLVDVRNNPISMKYGFSKSQLSRFCENLGILYVHFPEVGILSEQRQQLNTQSDYDSLFSKYRNELAKKVSTQKDILKLIEVYGRIALTCFESDICKCHRKHLSEAMRDLPEFKYGLKHI